MSARDDRHVEEAVRGILDADTRVDTSEVDVRVQHGIAYLQGSVGNPSARHAIQEDIQAVADVDGVVDRLTVRNFVKRGDEELEAAVGRALLRDATLHELRVSVGARDGKVTLRGRVPTEKQKSAVERVVWWIPGVVEVDSRIEVVEEIDRPDAQE